MRVGGGEVGLRGRMGLKSLAREFKRIFFYFEKPTII